MKVALLFRYAAILLGLAGLAAGGAWLLRKPAPPASPAAPAIVQRVRAELALDAVIAAEAALSAADTPENRRALAAACERSGDPAGVALALHPLLAGAADAAVNTQYVTACVALGWMEEAEAAAGPIPAAPANLRQLIAEGWAKHGQAARALQYLSGLESGGLTSEAYLTGAVTLLRCREPEKAAQWAQRGLALARGNPVACALLARSELTLGRSAAALQALSQARAGVAPDPILELWRGRAELRLSDPRSRSAGRERLARLAEGGGEMAVAAFEAGRAALKAGQPERGVNLLSRSLQSGYQPLLCYRELATGYAALGRHREATWAEGKSRMLTHQWPAAEAAFVRSAALDPAKPAAYLELSRTQSAQGRLADALQTCDRARKAGADSLDLRLHRASVLGRMERIPEQQRELEAASRLDPARANEPLGNLGRLYHDSQQFDRAITTLEEALRLEAGDGLAHLYLGLAYARRSEDPERAARAADHLLSAALIDPAYFYPWINAGSVLLGMGHVSEAAACYRRAMDGDSRWEGPYLSLSQLLQRQKRLPERKLVLQLYGRARTLEAERQRLENQAKDPAAGAEAHLALGERLLLDGRAKEACVELLIATAARPSLKRAQSRLADACALLDFDDLREEAERALR